MSESATHGSARYGFVISFTGAKMPFKPGLVGTGLSIGIANPRKGIQIAEIDIALICLASDT
jgi:hypothetical protein